MSRTSWALDLILEDIRKSQVFGEIPSVSILFHKGTGHSRSSWASEDTKHQAQLSHGSSVPVREGHLPQGPQLPRGSHFDLIR